MARTFNRAYDQADRMLNTSGLSSIVYQKNGGPVIRRFGGGGYSDEDAGVETSYGGGVEDWGISAADMEAAYSTGAFGPELAKESFFDPPDIESQRVHGSSPHDIYRHGEAYGKPPGSREQQLASDYYLGGDTSLSDFTGVGGQPSPEMKRGMEAYRQEGLRGMIQGGFDSPESYRDYMNHWKSAAEKERSDRYWAENPSGKWVTENYGNMTGTSLVLPEQAPISRNEAINNVLEDDTLSPEEKQEQIDYIFIFDDVVNRDMGRLKTATSRHREDWKARDRAKGYSSIAPPKRRTYKEGGKVMPGGLSNIKKSININGQPHSLAWINPGEASALKAMGGSGRKVEGIPAYFDEWSMGGEEAAQQMADVFADVEGAAAPGKPMEYDYDSPEYTKLISPEAQAALPSATTYYEGETTGPARYLATEKIPNFMEDGIPDKLVPYWNVLKDRGLSNAEAAARLSGMGTAGLTSMERAYDTGYSFGGPMGTMEGLSREVGESYSKKLKLKKYLEDLEDLEGKELSEEAMEKQRGDLISSFTKHAQEIGGEFIPSTKFKGMMSGWEDTYKGAGKDDLFHKGLGYLAPGALMTKVGAMGLNALTSLFGVIGEFITPEGQSYRVMDDGSLVPEDTYADTDEGTVERQPISSPPPLSPPPAPLEPELTGIAAELAKRPEVASIAQSRQAQFDNIARVFGREEAAKMLNLPENIFAEIG